MDKENCKRCYQKHECVWDEQLWVDGYIHCPCDLIRIGRDGVVFEKSPEVNILKSVFSVQSTEDDVPEWCEYK